MAIVKGNNFRIYSGDGVKAIGCETSCTLTITSAPINVTSKGSGAWSNREYGRKDWSIQSSSVIIANDAFDGSDTLLDPFEFSSYLIQGKKVVVKLEYTDGITTKFLIGKAIVSEFVPSGSAGEFGTADVTLLADGPLYATSNMVSREAYDGPSTLIYTHSGADAGGFTDSLLIGATAYFIVRNGQVYQTIYSLAPIGPTEYVVFVSGTGTVNFLPDLTDGDEIIIVYEPA
jgi:predicted secreted protein